MSDWQVENAWIGPAERLARAHGLVVQRGFLGLKITADLGPTGRLSAYCGFAPRSKPEATIAAMIAAYGIKKALR